MNFFYKSDISCLQRHKHCSDFKERKCIYWIQHFSANVFGLFKLQTKEFELLRTEMNDKTLEEEKVVEVTDIIGGYGPWQRNLFVLLVLTTIPSTWNNLIITFVAPAELDFWCARPPDFNYSEYKTMNIQQWRNRTSPTSNREQNRCEMVKFWTNLNQTVKCNAWEYNTTFYKSTIISKWDLVCDRKWFISLSMSVYQMGFMIALIVCGQISDTFGRRPILLLCYVTHVAAGILSVFSTSFTMFIVLRFFTAFGGSGFYTISFVLLVELVNPENRPFVGISVNYGWCTAFVSLPGLAWILRDWFWLQLVITLSNLLFLPIFWMIPESPRWLFTQNKVDQYRQLVTKAALKNGRSEPWISSQLDKLFLINKKCTEDLEKGKNRTRNNFFSLFTTSGLWKYSLNLFYCWFVNSFVYYALTYNTENLAGNIYLNFVLSGVTEFPAYICATYVLKKMGRRIPISAGMCAAGIAFAVTLGIPNNLFWLKNTLSFIGKFFISGTFAIVYVYSAEIYPTVIRSIAVGSGSAVARIGSITAPFLRELDTTANSSVISIIYVILSITSGILILLLPETNNLRFADTLDELKTSKKNKETEETEQKKTDIF